MEERSKLMKTASNMSRHINEGYEVGVIDKDTKMELHKKLDGIVYGIEEAYE